MLAACAQAQPCASITSSSVQHALLVALRHNSLAAWQAAQLLEGQTSLATADLGRSWTGARTTVVISCNDSWQSAF